MSPGDLGRAALSDDPAATALRLARWCTNADELERVAEWFAAVATCADALVLDKAGGTLAGVDG